MEPECFTFSRLAFGHAGITANAAVRHAATARGYRQSTKRRIIMSMNNTANPAIFRARPLASTFLATITLAITALASTPAAGSDIATFNGSVCQPYYGNSDEYRNYTYGIYNPSGSRSLYVTCPVDRDQRSSDTAAIIVNTYQSASTSTRFSCTAYSKDRYGYTREAVSRSLSGSQTGKTYLVFSMRDIEPWYGNFSVICRVPPYSGIRSIYFGES
jgi:hypothetical protein